MPWLWALLVLAAFVYLWGLGGNHMKRNGDEMVYAHIARVTAELCAGADLDFQVAGGQLEIGAGFAHQDIGQDG